MFDFFKLVALPPHFHFMSAANWASIRSSSSAATHPNSSIVTWCCIPLKGDFLLYLVTKDKLVVCATHAGRLCNMKYPCQLHLAIKEVSHRHFHFAFLFLPCDARLVPLGSFRFQLWFARFAQFCRHRLRREDFRQPFFAFPLMLLTE